MEEKRRYYPCDETPAKRNSGYRQTDAEKKPGTRRFNEHFAKRNGGCRQRDTEKTSGARQSIDLGGQKELTVIENSAIGSFLSLGDGQKVLLPFSEQTTRPKEGEKVLVTLYQDKGGRLTATMRTPTLKTGELGVLPVADITRVGIFLDNGMPKQLLVPFKEQICTPQKGSPALVYLYRDKSGREAATMRVYRYLSVGAPYQEGDQVSGFVYEVNPALGVFVAVDKRYFGLIPKPEVYGTYRYGETLSCRVLRVREDGKLDLSARDKSYASIEKDAEQVLAEIRKNGGSLPYADRADAALIEEVFRMSKNQFKRAVGNLYRKRLIEVDRKADTICLTQEGRNME